MKTFPMITAVLIISTGSCFAQYPQKIPFRTFANVDLICEHSINYREHLSLEIKPTENKVAVRSKDETVEYFITEALAESIPVPNEFGHYVSAIPQIIFVRFANSMIDFDRTGISYIDNKNRAAYSCIQRNN